MSDPMIRQPTSSTPARRRTTLRTRALLRRAAFSSRHPAGFTLTELLIGLALTTVLLLGISRVFTLTSETIGTGQALSGVVRAQRSIAQVLSADIIGVGPDINSPDLQSGMLPIEAEGGDGAQPAIIICNFRQAAFPNEATMRADVDYQQLSPTNLLDSVARSNAIRTVDTADGQKVPRYSYGDRNYRLDTFSFFTRGSFRRQTGSQVAPATAGDVNLNRGEVMPALTTNEAWVWYGHLRVFNSDPTALDFSRGYAAPGSPQTPGSTPANGVNNRNNLYASQFRLGRLQVLLKEPIDHDGNAGTLPTVVGDDGLPQNFIFRMNAARRTPPSATARGWVNPSENIEFSDSNNRAARTPLSYGSEASIYIAAAQDNHVTLATQSSIENGLTDVAGVSATMFRRRLAALYDAAESTFLNTNGGVNAARFYIRSREFGDSGYSPTAQDGWQEPLFASFNQRGWVNPFPAALSGETSAERFSPKKMSQRSPILSEGVTNFIVEFAGDFGTQDLNGDFTSVTPDGIIDYVVIGAGNNRTRQTRWYGMPRDVDGDGIIYGGVGNNNIRSSIDVVPVRDCVGGVLPNSSVAGVSNPIQMPFERFVPPQPTGSGNNRNYMVDGPDNTTYEFAGYSVAWGPQDFDGLYHATGPNNAFYSPTNANKYRPLMLRIIVDSRDEKGKLGEPLSQELVFPVRISN